MPTTALGCGMKGDKVRELQTILLDLGSDLGPAGADGVFGRKTESAVRAFQKARGLLVDGVVGPRTWAALRAGQAGAQPAAPPVPDGISCIRAVFGDIKVTMGPDQHAACPLQIAGNWVAENIVTIPIPGIKGVRRMRCHRRLAPVFAVVFADIVSAGLADEVKTVGSVCARHMRGKSGTISTHTWGIAVDVNSATNQRGTPGDMSPQIVAVFRKHGFKWGGDWRGKNRDPMHFQYCTGY